LKGFCEFLKTHLKLQELMKNNKKWWDSTKKSKINIIFLIVKLILVLCPPILSFLVIIFFYSHFWIWTIDLKWYVDFLIFFNYYNYFMINQMTCLDRVEGSDKVKNFVWDLVSYVDDKIKGNSP